MRVGQDFVRMRLIYVVYMNIWFWPLRARTILWLALGTTLSSCIMFALVCSQWSSLQTVLFLCIRPIAIECYFSVTICFVFFSNLYWRSWSIYRSLLMSFLLSLVMPRILIGLAFNFKPSWFMHVRNRIEPKIPSKIQGKLRIL